MEKTYVRHEGAPTRAYSHAVVVANPGKTIYLAGHTGDVSEDGKSLAGDFEAQCRQTFRNMEKTLKAAGASLSDIVTMTVFLADGRDAIPMTLVRKELLGGPDFPASAAIVASFAITSFARPTIMIEVQGIAVLP